MNLVQKHLLTLNILKIILSENVSKILYLLLKEEEGKECTKKLNSKKHTLKTIG